MTIIYGIPNCDTMKKARQWMDANHVEYQFHNYKKDGIEADMLAQWIDNVGWEVLLNRRGTTWRKLSDELKNDIDNDKAIALMCEHTSMIKRPVLVCGNHIEVGFSELRYKELLA